MRRSGIFRARGAAAPGRRGARSARAPRRSRVIIAPDPEDPMQARAPLAAAAAACLLSLSAHAKTPADTFVVAANMSQMITLDPAAINESFTAGFMRNVCDALVGLDDTDASKVVPGIAESWTVSPDSSTYTFRIRPGLRFPSGNPVT